MKYQRLITELNFVEQACNLRCDYCTAPLKSISKHNGISTIVGYNGETVKLDATSESELGIKMRKYLDKTYEIEPTPILHIIGGELTLLHGIADFILEVSSKYELVMLTTNGSLLDKDIIKILSSCKNFLLLFSIDGHTFEMNSHRIKKEKSNDRLLSTLGECFSAGIKVEIQTVLHDRNIKQIKEFADYLLSYSNSGHYIKIIPFPVRWTQGKFEPSSCDLNNLYELCEQYQYYQNILPPKKYIANLIDFFKANKRTTRCYVPYFVFGVDDRGRIKNCPCIPSMCSSLDLECDVISSDIVNEKELYKNKKVCSGLCNTCFEGWEIYNAYLQGNVSKEELKRMAVGQSKSGIKVLDHIKKQVIPTDNFSHIALKEF